ncbi:MAG TPA: response regulator [Janthinobacterium sp.]|nr:response regulator [Janthinobacterium sp.]
MIDMNIDSATAGSVEPSWIEGWDGLRVLHVDGDGDAALVLAPLLVPEAQVTHVATLGAAARAIRAQRYNLLVLDPDLPDGDGAALLEVLKFVDQPTPVLLYAGRDTVWPGATSAMLLKCSTSPRQLWTKVSQLLAAGERHP